MKKAIAIFLCVAMMVVMIPSFFASASPLPAQEAVVVAADDDSGTGQVNNDLLDPITTLVQYLQLVFGVIQAFLGEEFTTEIIPALKEVLQLVSASEFVKAVVTIWNRIVHGE